MEPILEFGAERFPLQPRTDRAERIGRSKAMLARALNVGNIVAFTGSGCSAPLGYPTWKEFVTGIVRYTRRRNGGTEPVERRLCEILQRLRSKEPVASRDQIFYLGYCQSVLGEDVFRTRIIRWFKSIAAKRNTGSNPYHALVELDTIERFVTSNYDDELENAIRDHRKQPSLSFTQEREHYGRIAGFALAKMPGLHNAVFHCHGSVASPASIVATEADYQKWYLDEAPEQAAFRQSLHLLFGSNPILFVGFGMEDDDLLRQLRILSAVKAQQKSARPVFALLPELDPPTCRDDDRLDTLYDRYGVHVIPFPASESDTAQVRGQRLVEALRGIREHWRKLADEWTKKPVIRQIEMPTHSKAYQPYQHYFVVADPSDNLAAKKTKQEVTELVRIIDKEHPRVVVITGTGGSGKSWSVLSVLNEFRKKRRRFAKGGIFFWSSYYADDWLTGLDRALHYLGAVPTARERRLDRFRDCLESGNHLLVFDGFERLLRETDDPDQGAPYSRSVESLLEVMTEKHNSTVVLTSRLTPRWPERCDRASVRRFPIRRLTTTDLIDGPLHALIPNDDDLSALCSLCGGHAYALQLAAKYLTAGGGSIGDRLQTLRRELGKRPPDARNSAMIRLALEACDEATDGEASKLLDRLAVFMSPVSEEMLAVCYKAAHEGRVEGARRKHVTDVLRSARLLFDVTVSSAKRVKAAPKLLTVHPTVRSFVFHRRHGAEGDSLPNFTLAGFTSGSAACDPGSRASEEIIVDLFDRLCTAARTESTPEKRRAMCRGAFGVTRSRMESNTVPRWTTYDAYVRYGVRLLYLTKHLSVSSWDYLERTYAQKRFSPQGILYADELAWLYNDLGLALCSEGYMSDAYALWEQGYEVDRVTDSEEEGGQYIVQSRLHMAHLFLEVGKLRDASEYLYTAERANAIYGDTDLEGRIMGYRALLEHLAGNLAEASIIYGAALEKIREAGRHNLRAESIFTRFLADLMIAKGDLKRAEELVREAFSRAQQGKFPDLEAYARKSLAHVWRERKRFAQAQGQYYVAMNMARGMGVKRLQADLHSELARLALDVGDWETARRRAVESLMLANELNLGLRRTHGLIILGRATLQSGDTHLAGHYFRHARDLAREQGYYLRGRDAELELQKIGEEQDV